jgi:acyl transferase domain-containing protein
MAMALVGGAGAAAAALAAGRATSELTMATKPVALLSSSSALSFLPAKLSAKPSSFQTRRRGFVSMSVSTSDAATATATSDAAFADYKASTAFLFPGQGAQAVGMGAEAHTVPAAAALYAKANEILG